MSIIIELKYTSLFKLLPITHVLIRLGYPGGSSYDSPREDYGTTSSRGSADSYHGSSNQPLPPLFRSSSDLHLDTNSSYAFPDQPLRREFGSADLVEAKQAGKRNMVVFPVLTTRLIKAISMHYLTRVVGEHWHL